MTAIAYRPADMADQLERNFIVDAWVGSYRGAKTSGIIQIEDWYPVMIPTVEKILAKPDVRTVVATVPGVTVADLLGFITADTAERPALVYYVFVKTHYRRGGAGRLWPGSGVGRGLFEAIGVDPAQPFNYVASTPMCRILERKIPMARWEPNLGVYPKSERRNRR
jgi:hypothetical protein